MFLDMVAALDRAALDGVVALVRGIAGEHPLAMDWAMRLPIEVNGLKMGVPTLLALYAWVHPHSGYRADPFRAVRGAAGVVFAIALARAAQELLPARPRPRVALPDFPFPPLDHLSGLADWSSMPSDTAMLAFALAAVAWTSSRRLGAAAAAWAVVVTCLPRLYFGYHYLSDLLAGAALGTLAVALASRAPLPAGAAALADARLRRLDARAPALLLLCFFALGAECLYVFQFTRKMIASASELVRVAAAERGEAAPLPSAVGPAIEDDPEAARGPSAAVARVPPGSAGHQGAPAASGCPGSLPGADPQSSAHSHRRQ